MPDARTHWERVYLERAPEQLSWYERVPETSLALIESAALSLDAAILDVGGGTSKLAGCLVAAGYRDITVVDISEAALEHARAELGTAAEAVAWIEADVRLHEFARQFDLWHDRAMLHFLVDRADRDRYVTALRRSLRLGGDAILATFGPGGPTHCSGLPVARYAADELSWLLGPDFELVSSRLEEHHTPAGRSQQFVYAHLRSRLSPPAQ